jgi:hypothetical protein
MTGSECLFMVGLSDWIRASRPARNPAAAGAVGSVSRPCEAARGSARDREAGRRRLHVSMRAFGALEGTGSVLSGHTGQANARPQRLRISKYVLRPGCRSTMQNAPQGLMQIAWESRPMRTEPSAQRVVAGSSSGGTVHPARPARCSASTILSRASAMPCGAGLIFDSSRRRRCRRSAVSGRRVARRVGPAAATWACLPSRRRAMRSEVRQAAAGLAGPPTGCCAAITVDAGAPG